MSNLKLFLATLVSYLLAVAIYNLFLILIVIGSLNLGLHYFHHPVFTFKEWLCSYVIGYLIILILDMKFFIELYESNKERANKNG